MTLAFVGIFCNLMVVSTIRDHDDLQESTSNLLLANIAISNLIISFLVKPISAVYVAYSMTTGQGRVGLAFCTLYTMAFRTTWIVFPFTILALCWNFLRFSLRIHLTHYMSLFQILLNIMKASFLSLVPSSPAASRGAR